ncbi:Transmembrane GTPase [Trichophyton interdigitale]|uniref:Transmembrane GTPase n=1 Tax=Trichophyton interdigitale TaxID=101480 RepID=A0A9P4YHJ3_9EURO|nr:Transmembrane GTPase [Trichophyton interdigitale]KAF3896193.1 Transmembrane GTPase [Trichophyton interdigitale]KAG8208280.1 Transmembrane GTPase [Trichophyton interdigitale]
MSSKDYFSHDAGSSAGEGSSRSTERHSPIPDDERPPSQVPGYMIVGSGPASGNATSLMSTLHEDSGYGGSIIDGNSDIGSESWQAGLMEDRPTPSHTPVGPGYMSNAAQHERQVIANHVHQLVYNSNRTKLGRSVTRAIELLKELQEMNRQWPAHYPSIQSTDAPPQNRHILSRTRSYEESREEGSDADPRPGTIKRTATSISQTAESSRDADARAQVEPRLVTPQIAREFSILKLDLKLGALSPAELVHSLEKNSIASLLDGKVSQSIKHLLALRGRIEDTSSKVLITGDLNAGKSTFCNALLRRKILPEDQQPCTSIFCEVLDARENGGVEEVHAIPKDKQYNRNDESTYDVYSLTDLESIVVDNSKYMQCKVYVKDVRTIDESLLNNGVVDIALIDAPGLNSDSVKTTAVFARQEEIDVVVFVLSAANHFTLSSSEFIRNAAHEKAYIFIVVNGFDNIRDTARCQRTILNQVAALSPHTYKESAELVHFVSSNAIPVAPISGSGGGDGGDDGDDDDDSKGKGKGKEKAKEKLRDFENLEGALRRFVLEKRSRSKLAPARTYLLNILSDLNVLASVNRDVASSELERVSTELSKLEPAFEKSKMQRSEISEQLERSITESSNDVYNYTRKSLAEKISTVAQSDLGVDYPGLLSVFRYAEDVKLAMLDQITACVYKCEDYSRKKCVEGVNMIQSLGLLHVGENKFPSLNFRSEIMFKQHRHELARQIHTELDVWDFIDLPGFWERQEKVAGTGMAMTVLGVLGGRALGGIGWLDGVMGAARILGPNTMRKLLVPGLLGATLLAGAYILSQVPTALPSSLSRKIAVTLAEMDYIHSNATRISGEVGRVLRVPATRLQSTLQIATEELFRRKEEVEKIKAESEIAKKYFSNLFRESTEHRRTVEQIDLDAQAPPAAA